MAAAILVMRLVGPDNAIDGESTHFKFKKWIDIESWSWDVTSSDDKIAPQNLRVTKSFDSSSPALMTMLDKTQTGQELEIVLYEGADDSWLELHVNLTDVTVKNLTSSVKTSEGGGSVEETWDFGYHSIQFTYYTPRADEPDVKTQYGVALFDDVNPDEQGSAKETQEKTRDFERIFNKMSTVEQDQAIDRLRKIAAGHIDPTKDSPNGALPQRTSTILRGRDNDSSGKK